MGMVLTSRNFIFQRKMSFYSSKVYVRNHRKTTLEDEVLEAYTDYVEERLIFVTFIDFQPDFRVVISAFLIVKTTSDMISLIQVVEIWSVRVC